MGENRSHFRVYNSFYNFDRLARFASLIHYSYLVAGPITGFCLISPLADRRGKLMQLAGFDLFLCLFLLVGILNDSARDKLRTVDAFSLS
jgi:hypothetical protein